MQTIQAAPNQLPDDFAVQHYGNEDGVLELIRNQTWQSEDDFIGLADGEIDLAMPISGNALQIDPASTYFDKKAVERIAARRSPVVTYKPRLERLHPATIAFHRAAMDFGSSISIDLLEWIDRLVRDLHGEPNIDYPTANIWSTFVALYPFATSDLVNPNEAMTLNLVDPYAFRLDKFDTPLVPDTGAILNGSTSFINTGIPGDYISPLDMTIGVWAAGGTGEGFGIDTPTLTGVFDPVAHTGTRLIFTSTSHYFWQPAVEGEWLMGAYVSGALNGHFIGKSNADTMSTWVGDVFQNSQPMGNVYSLPADSYLIGSCSGQETTANINATVVAAHYGRYLTDQEHICLNQALRAFNEKLQRI